MGYGSKGLRPEKIVALRSQQHQAIVHWKIGNVLKPHYIAYNLLYDFYTPIKVVITKCQMIKFQKRMILI